MTTVLTLSLLLSLSLVEAPEQDTDDGETSSAGGGEAEAPPPRSPNFECIVGELGGLVQHKRRGPERLDSRTPNSRIPNKCR